MDHIIYITQSVLVYKCVKTLSALTAHCTNVYLCSLGCEIVTLLDEYLHGNVCKDLENVKGGASGLQHFQCILSRACVSLHRCRFSNITSFHALLQLFERRTFSYPWFVYHSEIDQTLSSLETLAKVFDHPSGHLTFPTMQVHPFVVLHKHTVNKLLF